MRAESAADVTIEALVEVDGATEVAWDIEEGTLAHTPRSWAGAVGVASENGRSFPGYSTRAADGFVELEGDELFDFVADKVLR